MKLFECEKDEFYNIGSGKCEKNDWSHCLDDEICDGLKEILIKKEECGKKERWHNEKKIYKDRISKM